MLALTTSLGQDTSWVHMCGGWGPRPSELEVLNPRPELFLGEKWKLLGWRQLLRTPVTTADPRPSPKGLLPLYLLLSWTGLIHPQTQEATRGWKVHSRLAGWLRWGEGREALPTAALVHTLMRPQVTARWAPRHEPRRKRIHQGWVSPGLRDFVCYENYSSFLNLFPSLGLQGQKDPFKEHKARQWWRPRIILWFRSQRSVWMDSHSFVIFWATGIHSWRLPSDEYRNPHLQREKGTKTASGPGGDRQEQRWGCRYVSNSQNVL